jgi:glutamate dehydrogenase/leucine dehydrogenase
MQVFESFGEEYEQIVFAHDPASGLRTIIAIYSTALGPALGGTRFWPFASEEEAFRDALRLAKAMAYKASAAGLDLGGGKGVVIGDPRTDKTPELLRAYGRAVDRCGGAYVTTADVGTNSADLAIVAEATRHVTGTPGASGDPSPVTGLGVFSGIEAVAEDLWGSPSLDGRHVVVQGIGKVGSSLVRLLVSAGARLTISDLDAEAAVALARETGAALVSPTDALTVACDILAPCALGPVVTDTTLKSLETRAICGAANNQLERPDHAQALADAGILYAPDYIVNAGGLISVAGEVMGYDHDEALRRASSIGGTLKRVLERARADGVTTAAAADAIATERIAGREPGRT